MVSIRGMDIVLDISYFKTEYIDPVYYNKLIADHKGELLDIPAQYQVLKSWYESEYGNIVKNFDQQKLEQLRRDLENFCSNAVFMTGGDVRSAKMNGYRDSIMSANVIGLMKGNSIIWAHNSHVIKSGLQYNLFKAKSLGSYLYNQIGDGYYCILTNFSAVTNVNAQIGEQFKPKKHYPNKLSLSYRLMKDYQFGEGMVNAPALKALKLNDYNMNTISLEGRKVLLNGNSNSSDLFVVFSTISPSHLLF